MMTKLTTPFLTLALVLALIAPTSAFSVVKHPPTPSAMRVSTSLFASSPSSSRRDVLSTSAAVASGLIMTPALPSFAASGGPGSDPSKPIVVLGASGKTGRIIVDKLTSRSLYVKACTRSGSSSAFSPSTYLSQGSCDVTSLDSLSSAVSSASACVFAASASKKGGDAAHVDYKGVALTARACISAGVPRLVVISSGAVTRPQSIGFKITNVFGRIMDYKIAGESALRSQYAAAPAGAGSYVIVRPGGLSENASKGAGGVEVSQGDIYAAEIGREDVALVTIAALLKPGVEGSTFEVYGSGGERRQGENDA